MLDVMPRAAAALARTAWVAARADAPPACPGGREEAGLPAQKPGRAPPSSRTPTQACWSIRYWWPWRRG